MRAAEVTRVQWVTAATLAGLSWWVGTHFSLDDLYVYRRGARDLLDGLDPYARQLPDQTYTYPPFSLLAFLVMAWLPFAAVGTLFTATSAAATASIVGLLRHATSIQATAPRAVHLALGAAFVLSEPVMATLGWGQINLLIMLAVLLDIVVLPRRRAGVLLGLASAIKLTPLVFIAYLAICGRRREAVTAGVTALGATAVAWLVLPSISTRYFTHLLWTPDRIGPVGFAGNQSLMGLFVRLTRSTTAARPWWAASVVICLLVAAATAPWVRERHGELAGLSVVACTGLLVSPVSWTHHWVWWILPAVVMAGRASRSFTPARGAALVVWPAVFLLALPWAPARLPDGTSAADPAAILLTNSYVWCGLAVLGAAAVARVRDPGRAVAPIDGVTL